MKNKFIATHLEFDDVFNTQHSVYNGASGPIKAYINLSDSCPPQLTPHLPNYGRKHLDVLQKKCDEFEGTILVKPELVDPPVRVENIVPTFLVKKPDGDFRMVSAFRALARHAKPQRSSMPNIRDIERTVATWSSFIEADLIHAYFQLLLEHDSMKYCGVQTPYKGIRVYRTGVMGLPGMEAALEELLSRVLGDMIHRGVVAKIADNLYIGTDGSPEDLLRNWRECLSLLQANNLRLKAHKTSICPKSTNLLGWVWENGMIRANPHTLSALSVAEVPKTVKQLRSFIGSYKVLNRVLKNYSTHIDPLDAMTAGRESAEKLSWSPEQLAHFQSAKDHLSNAESIITPRPSDTLWIVSDGAQRVGGIGATLYGERNGKLQLAGYFSAKLPPHQSRYLPCEVEAIGIGTAVHHFAPYILQSEKPPQILTDSSPCVQAYDKLLKGEYSHSARVLTFLTAVSRYNAEVRHIKGSANLPPDFQSRHPIACDDPSTCHVCKFIAETDESVVRHVSVDDVLNGSSIMPYISKPAWLATQKECPDVCRAVDHIRSGTSIPKKESNVGDLRRYVRSCSVSRDGLLVVSDSQPFQPVRERIAVPRKVLAGLLTALHLRFNHPTKSQLTKLFNRYFYALDAPTLLTRCVDSCHQCTSLKFFPKHLCAQSTSLPEGVCVHFSADIMKRSSQCILVVREVVTSYTIALHVDSERHESLRDGLIIALAPMNSNSSRTVHARSDAGPGFVALKNDDSLKRHGISVTVGAEKNKNKNAVVDKAILELGCEILALNPRGGALSKVNLAIATASLNSRIRHNGISAWESLFQRDQLTGEQLPINDRDIILSQHTMRLKNHAYSSKSKAQGRNHVLPDVYVGDLVHIRGEKDKLRARERYIVVEVDQDKCILRKFSHLFRTKTYVVKSCDVYPVQPSMLPSSSTLSDNVEYPDVPQHTDLDHAPDAITTTGPMIPEPRAVDHIPHNPVAPAAAANAPAMDLPPVPAMISAEEPFPVAPSVDPQSRDPAPSSSSEPPTTTTTTGPTLRPRSLLRRPDRLSYS